MLTTRAPARTFWPIVVLGLAAVGVSMLARHLLYPAFSWNRDETVYLWQVAGLRAGQFTSTTGGFPASFHPWLAGIRHDSFFSQYTLGWPLILLAGDVVFGSPDAALAFGTALTVIGTYLLAREVNGDEQLARIAAAVMLISPIVIIQSGIHLGYLFTLGLGLLFATITMSAFRTGRHRRLAAAGLLLGWIFMTRPFDAVLWGIGVVGPLAWSQRGEGKRTVRGLVVLGLGFVPLLVATLAYNRHVTGAFGQFPITAADPLDTFGFGVRRIMPGFQTANYTPWQAVRSSLKQFLLLPVFMTGTYVLAAIGGWGLWRRRREVAAQVLLGIAVMFPLGYFWFWGMWVSSSTMPLSGPIYYIPLYAVLTIAGVDQLRLLLRARRTLALGLIVAMVLITVPVGVNRILVNRSISVAQLPWQRSSARAADHSLVFVWRSGPYLMFLNPYSANTPDLDGRVLYATDRGAANLDVIAANPDRRPYLQQTSMPPDGQVPNDHPKTPAVTMVPIQVVTGEVVSVGVSRDTDRPASSSLTGYVRTADGTVGPWTASVTMDASQLPPGHGTLTVGLGRGTTPNAAARDAVARRDVHYRVVDGRVEVLTPIDAFRRVAGDGKRHWEPVPPGVASPVALDLAPVSRRK